MVVGLRGCVTVIPVSEFITGDCGRVLSSSSNTLLDYSVPSLSYTFFDAIAYIQCRVLNSFSVKGRSSICGLGGGKLISG